MWWANAIPPKSIILICGLFMFIPTGQPTYFFDKCCATFSWKNVGVVSHLGSCCELWELHSWLCFFQGFQATLHIVPRSSSSASSRLHWLSAEFPGQKFGLRPRLTKKRKNAWLWNMLGLGVGYVWAGWGYSVVQMVFELEIGWNWHTVN